MNLPNKLTMLRIFMIPLFLVFFFMGSITYFDYYSNYINYSYLLALIVFAVASLTDLVDGKIARSRGLVTDFGKLMDPLADKLLVTAALCCILPSFDIFGIISLILILSREFLVTSVRLLAAGKGEVLAADIWGKIKTILQMSWIIYHLLLLTADVSFLPGMADFPPNGLSYPSFLETVIIPAVWLDYILLVGAVLLTVLSGAHYIIKNRKLFADA